MNRSKAIITSESAEPISDYEALALPLTCEIASSNLTCIVGDHSPLNNDYMRMLAGIDAPRSGKVIISGRDSNFMDEKERRDLRLKIGFVDIDAHLLSILNGFDNLKLPAYYHGVGTHSEIEDRAKRLISEIDYVADHEVIPAYMTGLQKRHLAIARALMLEPEVIFINKPLEGLDHYARKLIADYLANVLKNRGITVITGNTDIIFVSNHADKIVFIGMKEILLFNSWESFISSSDRNVIRFIEREQLKKVDGK